MLAPVQAHLLQRLLARGDDGQLHQAAAESSGYWDQERLAALPPARCEQLLVEALGAILDKCRKQPFTKRESDEQATGQQASGEKASGEQTGQRLFRIVQLRKRPAGDDASTAPQSSAASTSSVPTIDVTTGGAPGGDDDDDPAGGGRPCADDFHARLDCVEFGTLAEVHAYYLARIPRLRQRYGVLLFVYSVLLTKGLNDVKAELHDEGETLVQEPHGHGGQGLINLMLTGRAVQHVFDDVMHMYEDETNTKIICSKYLVIGIYKYIFLSKTMHSLKLTTVSRIRLFHSIAGHRQTVGHRLPRTRGAAAHMHRRLVSQESALAGLDRRFRCASDGAI